MPHHYILHKLHVHPKFQHTKKHLSHVRKTHPKSHGGALVRSHHSAVIHHPHHAIHRVHHTPPNAGMHIMGSGSHKKRLHPLKFKN